MCAPRPEGRRRAAPPFGGRGFNGLSGRTGRGIPCPCGAAAGRAPAGKRSRLAAAAVLRPAGAELFGEPQPEGK